MDERQVDYALETLSSLEVIAPNQRICTRQGKIERDTAPWIIQCATRFLTGESYEKNMDDVSNRIKEIFKLINIGIDMEDKTCQELATNGKQPFSNNLNFMRLQTTNRKNLKRLCTAMNDARKGMIEIGETYRKLNNDIAAKGWPRLNQYTIDRLTELEQVWILLQKKFPEFADKEPLYKKENDIQFPTVEKIENEQSTHEMSFLKTPALYIQEKEKSEKSEPSLPFSFEKESNVLARFLNFSTSKTDISPTFPSQRRNTDDSVPPLE